ncbi:MAG: hypothetical protein M3N13_10635 [Candidatus Eremiobacteraeota bacterium]|nr:hypothetical protein [Candidatus Eremiobacteraeota bacterium]
MNGVDIQTSTAVVEDLVVRLADNNANENEVLAFFERHGRPAEDFLLDNRLP